MHRIAQSCTELQFECRGGAAVLTSDTRTSDSCSGIQLKSNLFEEHCNRGQSHASSGEHCCKTTLLKGFCLRAGSLDMDPVKWCDCSLSLNNGLFLICKALTPSSSICIRSFAPPIYIALSAFDYIALCTYSHMCRSSSAIYTVNWISMAWHALPMGFLHRVDSAIHR